MRTWAVGKISFSESTQMWAISYPLKALCPTALTLAGFVFCTTCNQIAKGNNVVYGHLITNKDEASSKLH